MGEFVQVPGLIDAIRSIVNTQLASFAVLPNKIVIPLAPNVDTTKLYFPEPDVSKNLPIYCNAYDKQVSFLGNNPNQNN
jgi:hypothetical protein